MICCERPEGVARFAHRLPICSHINARTEGIVVFGDGQAGSTRGLHRVGQAVTRCNGSSWGGALGPLAGCRRMQSDEYGLVRKVWRLRSLGYWHEFNATLNFETGLEGLAVILRSGCVYEQLKSQIHGSVGEAIT